MSHRRDRDTKARRDTHRRHYDDNESIDSGYGGSSATGSSPRSPTQRHTHKSSPRRDSRGADHDGDMRRPDADREDGGSDSDSDYDPKAKYYLPVDDDSYQDISFQTEGERRKKKDKDKDKDRKESHDDHARSSRRPGSSHRHRSTSSGESEFNKDDKRAGRSRRDSTASRTGRKDSRHRRALSPILSEPSEDWDTASDKTKTTTTTTAARRPASSKRRSRAPSRSRSRGGPRAEDTSSDGSSDDRRRPKARRGGDDDDDDDDEKKKKKKKSRSQRSESPEYKYEGAPDMEDAWFKSVKERLVKGVDMKQVRKVGLDAAAVAAIKVAVGTQVPWKQRIPKTIAVGAAAALTDFLVSKTNIQPKGMVGTVFIRQFAEIILANLIINPASAKITSKASKYVPIGGGGGGGGGGQTGGPAPGGGGRAGGGGGRRR